MFRGTSPLLNLVACSPQLVAVPKDLPDHYRVTGDWSFREESVALPWEVDQFLRSGLAPLVVTLGSMSSVDPGEASRVMFEVVRRLGARAII